MLFNVVFILYFFAITSVRADKKKAAQPLASPGQMVNVLSSGLMPHYRIFNKDNKPIYLPAVFVKVLSPNSKYYAYVVPVVRADSPSSLFPEHLKQDVSKYLNENSGITGYFDLAGYQGVMQHHIQTSGTTTMAKRRLASMTQVIEKNISKNGMCPLEIKYPDLEKMNAISEEEDCLKTKPGQVVTFSQRREPSNLGVFVCWTGQGRMALMAILDKFSEVLKSEKISYSDLSGPGAKSPEIHGRVHSVDVSQLYFVYYAIVRDFRPALFLNENRFKPFMDTAAWGLTLLEYGPMSTVNQPKIKLKGKDNGNPGSGGGNNMTWW